MEAATLTAFATVRGAIIGGTGAVLVAALGLTGTIVVSENSAEQSSVSQETTRQFAEEEEAESLRCGDVYRSVQSDAEEDPEGVSMLFEIGEEGSLFSVEEREACPAYEEVLEAIRPSP